MSIVLPKLAPLSAPAATVYRDLSRLAGPLLQGAGTLDDFLKVARPDPEILQRMAPHERLALSRHVADHLEFVLAKNPDWNVAAQVSELLVEHEVRDAFLRSLHVARGVVTEGEWEYYARMMRGGMVLAGNAVVGGIAGQTGAAEDTDPEIHGLKFPQELWKDYGEWWDDLKRQAERFVKDYWQPQNNLSDREAQAKIEALIEMEKANYEKLLPLKAKAHEAIRDSLVLIPGGMFMMGADDISDNEKPVHAVWVSSFLMMDVPVTNRMWQAVMGTRPSVQCDSNGNIFSGDDQPVVAVSHNDALGFIKKIQLDGGGRIWLETEAQYEYVAKATRDYKYGTRSGELSHDLAVYSDRNSGGRGHTETVRSKAANPFMVYDLCGNIWEWCAGRWRVYTNQAQSNPVGKAVDDFVLRGGSWYGFFGPQYLRAACRGHDPRDRRYGYFGFRLVVAPRTRRATAP